ncbi:hypothetical protein BDQ17DRAFT_1325396 [Cyathus striatus]|nr:hypothetical protein BDQ17DRAFT_1325396 [Cyathus striatus]
MPRFTFNSPLPSPGPKSAEVHKGFRDPTLAHHSFAPRQKRDRTLVESLVSTTFFRCWHILLFYLSWASVISVLNWRGYHIIFKPTLLTVIGRRVWGQIILASRTFSRTVWFHVPAPNVSGLEKAAADEAKARDLILKKSVINLVAAHAVALKHYLRGEDGISIIGQFLPAYSVPQSIPSATVFPEDDKNLGPPSISNIDPFPNDNIASMEAGQWLGDSTLPPPVTATPSNTTFQSQPRRTAFVDQPSPRIVDLSAAGETHHVTLGNMAKKDAILPLEDEPFLLPACKPPKYHLLELFPFSLLVHFLSQKYKDKQSKRAKMKELLRRKRVNHNLPLEISLYISSYIALLQSTKAVDVPTTNALLAALNQLVEGATSLERVLTTPLPFMRILFSAFAVWPTLKWLTIPATGMMSFIFFGFLVAGEEIENPFGYDKNDLDLDHFTNGIIKNELKSITSTPPPDPNRWAFVPENNVLFSMQLEDRITPDEWAKLGPVKIQQSLGMMHWV